MLHACVHFMKHADVSSYPVNVFSNMKFIFHMHTSQTTVIHRQYNIEISEIHLNISNRMDKPAGGGTACGGAADRGGQPSVPISQ